MRLNVLCWYDGAISIIQLAEDVTTRFEMNTLSNREMRSIKWNLDSKATLPSSLHRMCEVLLCKIIGVPATRRS